jgi:periplasmic protein TonB
MPMLHDRTDVENHLERTAPLPAVIASHNQNEAGQRKRMLIALGILVVALVAVVLKDWDFWFPPGTEVQEANLRHPSLRDQRTTVGTTAAPPPATTPAGAPRAKSTSTSTTAPARDVPFSATTERAALPPLQVEVVAGNRHTSVQAKSNAIHLDVDSGAITSPPSAVLNASDRVQLSPQTSQSVSVSVPPNYPLLARQMKVQGAVTLQALISRDGAIQHLEVLSGPTILAAAAREAVKQWHFKPYLQNGEPVETQARITVNFTISTN